MFCCETFLLYFYSIYESFFVNLSHLCENGQQYAPRLFRPLVHSAWKIGLHLVYIGFILVDWNFLSN